MKIIFLGTGTSNGIPVIGCGCEVCLSSDCRDKRSRPSVLCETGGKNILIDAAPELRLQCLQHNVSFVDAVFFTHWHADHVGGIDDLRQFTIIRHGAPVECYGSERTLREIKKRYDYVFKRTQEGGGKPRLRLHTVEPWKNFRASGVNVTPLPVWHGSLPILGFRIGTFAYITDASRVPEKTIKLLEGVNVFVINALRHEEHPTHLSFAQAIDIAGKVGAKRTYFTHICHRLGHDCTSKLLPPGIQLAFDGLQINIPQ